MRHVLGLILLCFFLTLGCASTGNIKDLAPTPPESQLIAHQVMKLALTAKDVGQDKLLDIRTIMVDSERILLAALKDGTSIEAAHSNYLASKNPELGALANTVLAILTYRLRPLVDQGKTDLAAQYIQAVLAGAVIAIDEARVIVAEVP